MPYLTALRPHQWLKNTLVFLPMLAAHQVTAAMVSASVLAFIAFCLVASSVYVVNDLVDLSADRAHPRKRTRPFAAGQISVRTGMVMAAGLLALGAATAFLINPLSAAVLAGYFLLTLAYTLHFKRKIIIDICILAGLYTLRIEAGSAATGLTLSFWLLAFSMFFFLSLAAVKRQAELVDTATRGKLTAMGRGYHAEDLPIMSMIAISAGYVSVLVMALYVNSPNVLELYGQPSYLWGVCAVLAYWITRIVMVTHRGGMLDDPIVYAAQDPVSWICFLIIIGFVLGAAVL